MTVTGGFETWRFFYKDDYDEQLMNANIARALKETEAPLEVDLDLAVYGNLLGTDNLGNDQVLYHFLELKMTTSAMTRFSTIFSN